MPSWNVNKTKKDSSPKLYMQKLFILFEFILKNDAEPGRAE